MTPRTLRLAVLGVPVAALVVWSQEPTPHDVGLVERAERQLVQVDVTVDGPPELVSDLGPKDFEVRVAGRKLDDFLVDKLCPVQAAASSPTAQTAPPVPETAGDPVSAPKAPAPARPGVTYLLYFDQQFLTIAGRNQGLRIARELVPELLRAGDRVTVISSGREVTTYASLTGDPQAVVRALDEIERDPAQWDPSAVSEETRIGEVLDWLRRRGADEAAGIARRYQTDERWRAERALRLFSMVLGRFADVEPPKAVIYFADRMRSRPGEHYLSFFSAVQADRSSARSMELDSELGALAFDRVVNEANAHGVRLYTVIAEGLTTLGSISMTSSAPGTSGGRHLGDARDSMTVMAHETGGEAFVHGAPAARIASVLREDLSCVYLISFPATDLARDRALPLTVRMLRPRVEARARGQIFVPSDSKRLTSRLLAAFAAPEALRTDERIHGTVIPTGHADGKFTALVQIAVAGSPLPGTTWDVGLSVLSRGEVRADAARRVTVPAAGVPIVLEMPLSFAEGPYEIALVAHDGTTGEVLAGRAEGSFPDLEEREASVGPLVLLQPEQAAFVRGDETKSSGALGRSAGDTLATDRPTAIVTLVCRAKRRSGVLRVERRLVGASSVDFEPLQLDLGADRCAQVRDLIRAGSLTGGAFRYELRVLDGETELAAAARDFDAAGSGMAPPSGGS